MWKTLSLTVLPGRGRLWPLGRNKLDMVLLGQLHAMMDSSDTRGPSSKQRNQSGNAALYITLTGGDLFVQQCSASCMELVRKVQCNLHCQYTIILYINFVHTHTLNFTD